MGRSGRAWTYLKQDYYPHRDILFKQQWKLRPGTNDGEYYIQSYNMPNVIISMEGGNNNGHQDANVINTRYAHKWLDNRSVWKFIPDVTVQKVEHKLIFSACTPNLKGTYKVSKGYDNKYSKTVTEEKRINASLTVNLGLFSFGGGGGTDRKEVESIQNHETGSTEQSFDYSTSDKHPELYVYQWQVSGTYRGTPFVKKDIHASPRTTPRYADDDCKKKGR